MGSHYGITWIKVGCLPIKIFRYHFSFSMGIWVWNYEEATLLNGFDDHDSLVNELDSSLLVAASGTDQNSSSKVMGRDCELGMYSPGSKETSIDVIHSKAEKGLSIRPKMEGQFLRSKGHRKIKAFETFHSTKLGSSKGAFKSKKNCRVGGRKGRTPPMPKMKATDAKKQVGSQNSTSVIMQVAGGSISDTHILNMDMILTQSLDQFNAKEVRDMGKRIRVVFDNEEMEVEVVNQLCEMEVKDRTYWERMIFGDGKQGKDEGNAIA
ncbi:Regulatory-associated protein of TOR [Ancistrocladus abbreviatus]